MSNEHETYQSDRIQSYLDGTTDQKVQHEQNPWFRVLNPWGLHGGHNVLQWPHWNIHWFVRAANLNHRDMFLMVWIMVLYQERLIVWATIDSQMRWGRVGSLQKVDLQRARRNIFKRSHHLLQLSNELKPTCWVYTMLIRHDLKEGSANSNWFGERTTSAYCILISNRLHRQLIASFVWLQEKSNSPPRIWPRFDYHIGQLEYERSLSYWNNDSIDYSVCWWLRPSSLWKKTMPFAWGEKWRGTKLFVAPCFFEKVKKLPISKLETEKLRRNQ